MYRVSLSLEFLICNLPDCLAILNFGIIVRTFLFKWHDFLTCLMLLPDILAAEGYVPEEEILSVLNVPPGKMGRVIGKRGASIRSVKESCK